MIWRHCVLYWQSFSSEDIHSDELDRISVNVVMKLIAGSHRLTLHVLSLFHSLTGHCGVVQYFFLFLILSTNWVQFLRCIYNTFPVLSQYCRVSFLFTAFIQNIYARELYFISRADRTNGRAYATVLRPSSSSVCLSVTLCIVAKRCILEQKLLLRAYRKSYMRNRLVPKW